MTQRYAIILAAGQGSRMKSKLYKVLHPVAGKPMVEHVVGQVEAAGSDRIVTIVGFGAEQVKEHLGDSSDYALQAEQLGTCHAVLQAESLLKDKDGITLVICGDTPLLTAETLNDLFDYHQEKGAKATILTAVAEDPTGYGRVLRDDLGIVTRIVEQKDATQEEARVQEINTGTYCFDNEALFDALSKVGTNNAQGEYYLTDTIKIMRDKGQKVGAFNGSTIEELMGVNSRVELSKAEEIMRRRINESHMINGVTIIDVNSTYIEADVEIGNDTIVYPGAMLRGNTIIGSNCIIGMNSNITNSKIGDYTEIENSTIIDSIVGENTNIGPYAYLRPNSNIGNNVKIGDFVEVKNATIEDNSKASHYLTR